MAQEKLSLTFNLGATTLEGYREVEFKINGEKVNRDNWLAIKLVSDIQAIRQRLDQGIPILLSEDPPPIVDPSGIVFPRGG